MKIATLIFTNCTSVNVKGIEEVDGYSWVLGADYNSVLNPDDYLILAACSTIYCQLTTTLTATFLSLRNDYHQIKYQPPYQHLPV